MSSEDENSLRKLIGGYIMSRDAFHEQAYEELVSRTNANNVVFIAQTILAHPEFHILEFSNFAIAVARPGFDDFAKVIHAVLTDVTDKYVIEDLQLALDTIAGRVES